MLSYELIVERGEEPRCQYVGEVPKLCRRRARWRDALTGQLLCRRHVSKRGRFYVPADSSVQCQVMLINGMFCWRKAARVDPVLGTLYCERHWRPRERRVYGKDATVSM